LVTVAFFLPGWAKGLSAPRYIHIFCGAVAQGV